MTYKSIIAILIDLQRIESAPGHSSGAQNYCNAFS